jgi:hypothetical protein
MSSDNLKEFVIEHKKLSLFAMVLLFLQLIIMFGPFVLIWGWNITSTGMQLLLIHLIFWLVPIIILHEGLHGLVWALSVKKGYKYISFGFNRELLSPYTHCKIPLRKWQYIAGGLAPLFVTGIFPSIIAFIIGNPYWFCLSLFCIWSSAGDMLSCYYLLKIPNNWKVQDHPEKLGFFIIPT